MQQSSCSSSCSRAQHCHGLLHARSFIPTDHRYSAHWTLASPHIGAHPGGHFGGFRAIILIFQLPHDVSHPVCLRESVGSIGSLSEVTASNVCTLRLLHSVQLQVQRWFLMTQVHTGHGGHMPRGLSRKRSSLSGSAGPAGRLEDTQPRCNVTSMVHVVVSQCMHGVAASPDSSCAFPEDEVPPRRSLVEIAIPLHVVELHANLLRPLLLPLLPCTDVKVSLNPLCRAAALRSGSDMA